MKDLRPITWLLRGRYITAVALAIGLAGYLAGRWMDRDIRKDWFLP